MGDTAGKGAPPSPDFNAAAQTQADASERINEKQTWANRPDQYNAFGGYSNWEYTPGTGDYASGAAGGADGSMPTVGSLAGASGGSFGGSFPGFAEGTSGSSGSGLDGSPGRWTQRTGINGPLGDASTALQRLVAAQTGQPISGDWARDQAITGAYGQATSRLDPMWSQRGASLENQLANEGFSRGDEAWQREIANFGRDRNDAYTSAMNSAIGQGTAAGAALFDQNMAARNLPFQQLAQIRGLTAPDTFASAGASDPVQSLAAAAQQYGAGLDKYNAGQASKNSMMQAAPLLAAL